LRSRSRIACFKILTASQAYADAEFFKTINIFKLLTKSQLQNTLFPAHSNIFDNACTATVNRIVMLVFNRRISG